MKKSLMLILAALLLTEAKAQTNTFPASGYVGIGTTGPASDLYIKNPSSSTWLSLDKIPNMEAGLQFRKSGSILFYLFTDNADNDAIKIQTGGNLPGENDDTPRLHIPYSNKNIYMVQSGGSVAMGHNNPYSESRLHLKSPTSSQWGFVTEAMSNNRLVGIGHTGSAGYISVSYLGNAGYSPLYFRTSEQTRMTILEDGKVGVGTPTPSTKFQVEGAGGHNVDLRVNGRIHVGDVNESGGVWVNGSGTLFMGQQGTTKIGFYNNGAWRLVADPTGKVGIGTTSPDQMLTVKGKVHAEEVIIDLSVPAPDYVFEKSYDLKPLDEVKKYIDENKHLPEIPSAKEMEKDGVKVGEMEMLLLRKIEELTLYLIHIKEKSVQQDAEIVELHKQIVELKKQR